MNAIDLAHCKGVVPGSYSDSGGDFGPLHDDGAGFLRNMDGEKVGTIDYATGCCCVTGPETKQSHLCLNLGRLPR